jgi:hypothetical protein
VGIRNQSKFVAILMQRVCNDACVGGPTDIISPVYSLWATFIGLYVANYVVERSTGYALLSFVGLACSYVKRLAGLLL